MQKRGGPTQVLVLNWPHILIFLSPQRRVTVRTMQDSQLNEESVSPKSHHQNFPEILKTMLPCFFMKINH